MEVRLLGPVEIVADNGVTIDGGVPQRRAVLAALAFDAGRLVTRETLIDRVWGDEPPAGARAAVYAHVTRIRGMLDEINALEAGGAGVYLRRQPGGYALRIDPDRVDLHRCQRLITEAEGAGSEERVVLLRQAVALWRGQPLAGVIGDWAARTRRNLGSRRLETVAAWAQAELTIGNAGGVLGPLTELVDENPLLEPLTAALMSALAAVGRTSDALGRYTAIRRRLADELGIDPSAELQAVYQAILRGNPLRPLAAATPVPDGQVAAAAAVPAQLPGDVASFTGRAGHLAQLDALLGPQRRPGGSTSVVISAVSGTAGIGKTALAVHWAHRVRGRFPDGQLYVNLRGFGPSAQVMSPTEAVCGFLNALGIPPHLVPATLDAQVGLYRTLIADKRMLVLIDNARDAEQARPLLPASPTAVAVVTSRNQLAALTVTDGAHPVSLDLLTPLEARDLLAQRLGRGRVAADPTATEAIVAGCARLPLALTIAAARALQTGFPLTALAAELGDARGRLDALDAGETASEVRAVFSWSYATLTPEAARMFRLLGLHPGQDISELAAASLADQPVRRVRRSLAELVRANLLAEDLPGRYACHDLLRAYAADLALDTDRESDRDGALDRLLEYYLQAATAAARHSERASERASDWFAREQPNLVAATDWAATHHRTSAAVGIPAALHEYLRACGSWPVALHLHRIALAEARWADDQPAQARTLTNLADTQYLTGDYARAAGAAEDAVELFHRLADRPGQVRALYILARVRHTSGDYRAAATSARQSLELSRQLGDRHGQACALYILGRVQHTTSDLAAAAASARQCLELFRQLGDRHGEARARYLLGYVQHLMGDHTGAAGSVARALDLFRELGDRLGQANALDILGLVQHTAGQHGLAATTAGQALDLFRQLGERLGQANALTTLGLVRQAAGDQAAAATSLGQALDLFREVEDPDGQAEARNHIGTLLLAAAKPAEAREQFDAALAIARGIGTPLHEGRALEGIGNCALQTGNTREALEQLRQALAIYERIDSRYAQRVQSALDSAEPG